MISIRVAKTDGEGRIIPLDDSERRNLTDYIDTIQDVYKRQGRMGGE